MIRSLLTAAAAASFVAGAASAAVIPGLVYGPGTPTERQEIDLYLPDGVSDAPIVAFFYGGAWLGGNNSNPTGVDAFLARGIGVAAVDYRHSSDATWPGQLDDVQNALAFLRSNGATYGYDSSRLASFGFSSGAHLAAWAGLVTAADPATRLAATVTWSAPTELFYMDEDDTNDAAPLDFIAHSQPGSPESLLIGATVADNKALADAASPTVYARGLASGADLPAFLLMHGDQDPLVSSLQSQRLYDALLGIGAEAELEIIAGAGHGGAAFNERIPYVVDFIAGEFGMTIAPVPLPASFPLVLVGIGAFAALRRARR